MRLRNKDAVYLQSWHCLIYEMDWNKPELAPRRALHSGARINHSQMNLVAAVTAQTEKVQNDTYVF